MDDFWRRSDVRVKDVRLERIKRTRVEVQQAIRFNLFISYRRRRGPKMPACRRRA
jgi:hypothetical protein